MKVRCEFCDNTYEDNLSNCPSCGAVNTAPRAAGGDPRTIEELQKWYADRNLPPYSVTRFFIGEDYKGPKAFGIYQDPKTQEVVVYKNKADGTRAVR